MSHHHSSYRPWRKMRLSGFVSLLPRDLFIAYLWVNGVEITLCEIPRQKGINGESWYILPLPRNFRRMRAQGGFQSTLLGSCLSQGYKWLLLLKLHRHPLFLKACSDRPQVPEPHMKLTAAHTLSASTFTLSQNQINWQLKRNVYILCKT